MAKERPIVWVDMDGTMYDFDTPVLAGVPVAQHVVRRNFYITDDYPEEFHGVIHDTYNASDFFHNLQLFDGVKESWQAMLDAGYDPRILSAPLTSNPSSLEGKQAALERDMVPEFGPTVLKDARFDKSKWRYEGLVLFDDRPEIGVDPETGTTPWTHVLFGWEHLSTVPMSKAAFRLLNWREPATVLQVLDTVQDINASRRLRVDI